MSTEPVRTYIKARDALRGGDRAKATSLLAESMGASEPTEVMAAAVEQLLDTNEAALTLVINETRKQDGRP